MNILVTGGAGFIGSNFIIRCLNEIKTLNRQNIKILNLDSLTYAGNKDNCAAVINSRDYVFVHGSIADHDLVMRLFEEYQFSAVVNFAAETHVDRSISAAWNFIQTNINGTYNLLECARNYWLRLAAEDKEKFRFIHVSTDEVYGSLAISDPAFTESNAYKPSSPYSASKASADHLVCAWYHTYGLPTIITNCSNNYGPFQHPEKLIPMIILNIMSGQWIPIYGNGQNIRDWLHVEDHCNAILQVLARGEIGQSYNIGANNEKTNIEVAHMICEIMDTMYPHKEGTTYKNLIRFVQDRAGHDKRYAVSADKIKQQLGWQASISFADGLKNTVSWYLNNNQWLQQTIQKSGVRQTSNNIIT